MSRLVDADAIKLPKGFFEKVDNVPKFYEWLNTIPTIDPVKHGRWIHDGKRFESGVDWMHCSECGNTDVFGAKSMYHYCPNCGARMRGDGDE